MNKYLSRPPAFILAKSWDGKRNFVVHARNPIVIAEVFERNGIEIEAINYEPAAENESPERLAGLMRRMADWYHSTLIPKHKNS